MKKRTLLFIVIVLLRFSVYSQDRIVNGNDANIADFPWQVMLEMSSDGGFSYSFCCGGVIIDENWALTAAHCIMDTIMFEFRIRAGIELLSSSNAQVIEADAVYVHPAFSMDPVPVNDIALLHLSTPLNISDINIEPLSVVTQQDSINGLTDPGVIGLLSGWGNIDTNWTVPDRLQYLAAPVYPLADANQPSMYNGQLCYAHLPINPAPNSGVCFGDSGGPFVVPNQDSSAYLLAGLMSFIASEHCGDSAYADILTRISVFSNWINSYVNTQKESEKYLSYTKVYPNPAKGVFYAEGENIQTIEITNISGQVIRQITVKGNRTSIDMTGQPYGMYFVKIRKNGFNSVEKIIIK